MYLEELMVKAMGLSLLPMTCSPLLPVEAKFASESDSASERYEPSFAEATSSSLASLVSPSADVWMADRLGSFLGVRGREEVCDSAKVFLVFYSAVSTIWFLCQ